MTGEQATGRFRLFVAITVPDAVRAEVLRVQRELKPLAPRDVVRWTKPEQFHLTLRFLGDVPSAQIAGLQESLYAVSGRLHCICARKVPASFRMPVRRASFGWASLTRRIAC